MATKDVTWQPKWVPLSILDFARIVHSFGEDSEALAKWTRQFADDLLFCNVDTNDDFTRELLSIANEKYTSRAAICKKAGKASAKARKQKSSGSATPADKREQGDDNTANLPPSQGPEEGKNFEARQSLNADGDADFREKSDEHTRSATGQPVTTCGVTLESGTSPSATDINDQETEAQVSTSEARQGQMGAGAPPVSSPDCHNAPAPYRRVKPPKNSAEVMAFAADHGIDEVDARDWYELNYKMRPGCDKDGCVIENWPGHCISYCRAVKEKRESA